MRLFDSHAHYNDRRFAEEFDGGGRGALLRAHAMGVERFCNVGSSVCTSEESIRLAEEFDFVVAAVGIHPSDAQEIPASEVDQALAHIEVMTKHERVRAVGKLQGGKHHLHVIPGGEEKEPILSHTQTISQVPACFQATLRAGDVLILLIKILSESGIFHFYWETHSFIPQIII